LVPLSKNLAAVGAIGLAALDYIESGKTIPEEWRARQLKALDAMDHPVAEVRLAAIRRVRELLGKT
jgi:hypothetical protein